MRARPVDVVDLVGVGNADGEVAEQTVTKPVDETVYRERSARCPGILDNGCVAHVTDLLDDVEFAQSLPTLEVVRDRIELLAIARINVLNVSKPVVDQPELPAAAGGVDATAAVMAADDDILDLENLDAKLKDRQAADVSVDDEVRHVAVYEHFARLKAQDFVGGNTAI